VASKKTLATQQNVPSKQRYQKRSEPSVKFELFAPQQSHPLSTKSFPSWNIIKRKYAKNEALSFIVDPPICPCGGGRQETKSSLEGGCKYHISRDNSKTRVCCCQRNNVRTSNYRSGNDLTFALYSLFRNFQTSLMHCVVVH
jgi:hypothetical protein